MSNRAVAFLLDDRHRRVIAVAKNSSHEIATWLSGVETYHDVSIASVSIPRRYTGILRHTLVADLRNVATEAVDKNIAQPQDDFGRGEVEKIGAARTTEALEVCPNQQTKVVSFDDSSSRELGRKPSKRF